MITRTSCGGSFESLAIKIQDCILDSKTWKWKDQFGYWHLIKDGCELTIGIKAKRTRAYLNGWWKWQDENKYWHLVDVNGTDLTKGLKAISADPIEQSGDEKLENAWMYLTKEEGWISMINGKKEKAIAKIKDFKDIDVADATVSWGVWLND